MVIWTDMDNGGAGEDAMRSIIIRPCVTSAGNHRNLEFDLFG